MKPFILFMFLICMHWDSAAAQENKHDLYSFVHMRLAYGKDPMYGVSNIVGVETNKFRFGLGIGYETTKMKIDDKKRPFSFMPIILRNEILTENPNRPNLYTELGCGMAWMKDYDMRCGGYFGVGFSLIKGQLCIMYRRQIINIKDKSNILRHQAYASFGFKV